MHTIEKKEEGNIFAEGMAGWKMVFDKFKKKKPEQQQTQQQGDGYSMANQ